jgi:hypothetical protein
MLFPSKNLSFILKGGQAGRCAAQEALPVGQMTVHAARRLKSFKVSLLIADC